MNRISDLTRRLWAALLALCLVLALTLPVFAEGESGTADTAEKETFHIGTVDDLMQLADSCRLDSWSKNRTVYLDADLELLTRMIWDSYIGNYRFAAYDGWAMDELTPHVARQLDLVLASALTTHPLRGGLSA